MDDRTSITYTLDAETHPTLDGNINLDATLRVLHCKDNTYTLL